MSSTGVFAGALPTIEACREMGGAGGKRVGTCTLFPPASPATGSVASPFACQADMPALRNARRIERKGVLALE